ncbi:MAG TPA: hypothetical protein VM118_09310, partial [Acidobacteriota bacterium]|nr:hypothetical protein [Acidobacteriota bacterium]
MNVSVESVPSEPYIVMVNQDGGRKQFSRSNIRMVLDQQGADISNLVLHPTGGDSSSPADSLSRAVVSPPNDFKPDKTTEKSKVGDRGYSNRPEYLLYGSRFRFALSGGVGYGAATGDWFEGFNSGLAWGLAGRLALTDYIFIGLSYRHQKLELDSELQVGPSARFDFDLNEAYFLIGFMTRATDYNDAIGFL